MARPTARRLGVFVAVLCSAAFVAGCHDFDALYADCADAGRCGVDGGAAPGTDGGSGSDAGTDAGAPLDPGAACLDGAQCGTGHCVDGVCCDLDAVTCSGCRACNLPDSMGTCANVPVDADPHESCTASVSSCTGETCNGLGGCAVPDGTSCGMATCTADTMTTYACADGGCVATPTSCAPNGCGTGGTCAGTCVSGTAQGCAAGLVCVNGACVTPVANGTACTFDLRCQSGNCVDGFCCDQPASTCSGCYACNLTPGTCTPIPKGQDPNNVCNADAGACQGASCDGAGACTAQNGTPCGSFCATSQQIGVMACSGGSCLPTGQTFGCGGGQACDGGMCVSKLGLGSACTQNTECSSGDCVDGVCCQNSCNGNCQHCNASGNCVNYAAGTDPENDCGAYFCNGSSACYNFCSSTNASTRCKSGVCTFSMCE